MERESNIRTNSPPHQSTPMFSSEGNRKTRSVSRPEKFSFSPCFEASVGAAAVSPFVAFMRIEVMNLIVVEPPACNAFAWGYITRCRGGGGGLIKDHDFLSWWGNGAEMLRNERFEGGDSGVRWKVEEE